MAPIDLFDYLDWQARRPRNGGKVVRLAGPGASPATMNRRIATVRGLFEYAVCTGQLSQNPVPAARRSSGLRAIRRGCWAISGRVGPGAEANWCANRSSFPSPWIPKNVAAFIADLQTHRDRAITLAMVLGRLRSAEGETPSTNAHRLSRGGTACGASQSWSHRVRIALRKVLDQRFVRRS